MVIRRLVLTLRHPLQRLVGEWQVDRFFGLLHSHRQTVLAVINKDILPFQADNITDAQSAEAGKQIGVFNPPILYRSGNQRPYLFDGHIGPHALRHFGLLRFFHFIKWISQQPFSPDGSVQGTVEYLIIGIACRCCYRLSFGAEGRQHVVDIALAKSEVNPIQQKPFPCIFFQDMGNGLDLTDAFLVAFLLVLQIGLHPVQQINLICMIHDTGFAAGQFDNAFRLDGIRSGHCYFILPTGIVVRSRDKIQLQVLVCPLAIAVYIQIQTFAAIGQILHPKTDGFFYFFRLLYSWHNRILSFVLFRMQMYELKPKSRNKQGTKMYPKRTN